MSCGRRPAPRNVVKWSVGRPAPRPPRELVGECPLMGSHARPVGILQASQARPAPLKGEPFARAKPAREASPSGEVAAEQAGRVQPVDGGHNKVAGRACPAPTDCRESSCTRGAREGGSTPPFPLTGCRGRLRAAYMPPLQSCRSPLRGFGGTPEFKVEEGAGALRTKSNTAFV